MIRSGGVVTGSMVIWYIMKGNKVIGSSRVFSATIRQHERTRGEIRRQK